MTFSTIARSGKLFGACVFLPFSNIWLYIFFWTHFCTWHLNIKKKAHINIVDNNSDVNESQSIDINSINLNNHTSNDCESPSDSDNIATRVKAKYSKARQKKIHKKSQKSNTRRRNNIYNQTCKKRKTQTRNLDILSPSESLSIEY